MTVNAQKVDELEKALEDDFPDYEILYKDNYQDWPNDIRLWAIRLFVMVMGLIAPEFTKRFEERIANGIGRFIILPNKKWSDMSKEPYYKLIRHEFVHMRDSKRHPVWFPLSYILLPLPTIFSMRAHWELRGYTQNMIVEYEQIGRVSKRTRKWITSQFTSSLYFWMLPFEDRVAQKVNQVADKVEEGWIEGMYPDVSFSLKEMVTGSIK